ncbi:MAG: VOC family protein [Owenweeksia sp.]
MLQNSKAFGSFSTNNMTEARKFYGETLGLNIKDNAMDLLELHFPGGGNTIIYPKPDHKPAVFTVLSFPVKDIDETVDALIAKGISMDRYEGFKHDKKGIVRSQSPDEGPSIAWFKDPAGNILSVLEDNF